MRKGWKNTDQANGPPNQAGVAILISHKVDFKLTLVKSDKEGNIIPKKGAIHQEEKKLSTYKHPMLVHPTSLNIHLRT
jgi:hypothetical protein